MNEASVIAYLARIGLVRPESPDAAYLQRLHSRHLHTVPFENLSIHLGEDVPLDEDALFDKIVTRRRGGYCYEVNGLLAALLRALGYQVSLLAVRVHGDNGFSPPFDHLALRVDLDEPWLVDVGFGRHTEFPLRLDHRGEQKDPGGLFRIEETPDGDLDVYHDGTPVYRVEQRPRELADFTIAHGFQRFSPTSHFARSPFCNILADDGMITLAGRKLITTTQDGVRSEEMLEDDAQVLVAYRTHFGLALDRVPDHSQGESRSGVYSGALPPADLPLLHAYVEDVAGWVLGEAAGSPLSPELRESLCGELAAILSGGLGPALAAEVARNTDRRIAGAQEGPVRLDSQGRMTVAGLELTDVARLIDAVGQLLEHGVGDSMDLLHPTHRSALYAARDAWTAAQRPLGSAEDRDEDQR